ncbi:MAG: hypothetical protein JNL58_27150 [Planctomyces sp.]|nr:hypothetical protein [Planctomyces sp.]
MKSLVARIALRFIQLILLLVIVSGLSNVRPLVEVFQENGPVNWTNVCRKIVAVSGPVFPSVVVLAGLQALIRYLTTVKVNPSQPWLSNPEWAAKHIRLNNRGITITILIFAAGYLTVFVPLAVLSETRPLQIIIGVIGLVLLLMGRVFWMNRKWNTAELRMAQVPGVIGGPFTGVVTLQQDFPSGTPFEVCLKCERTHRSRSSRSGSRSDSRTTTIWSSTLYIDKPLNSEPGKTNIPFSFAIPFDSRSTTSFLDGNSDVYCWMVVVNIKDTPNAGGSVFPVPIFRTEESREDYRLSDELIAPYLQEVDVDAVLARIGMRRSVSKSGHDQLEFFRRDFTALAALFVMTVLCAVGVYLSFKSISASGSAAFVALFPGLLAALFTYLMVDMLFWKASIELSPEELRFSTGIAGFRQHGRAPRGPLTKILCELDFHKQNGEWWCLKIEPPPAMEIFTDETVVTRFRTVHDADDALFPIKGIPLKIVKHLNGRNEAEAVQKWLAGETHCAAVALEQAWTSRSLGIPARAALRRCSTRTSAWTSRSLGIPARATLRRCSTRASAWTSRSLGTPARAALRRCSTRTSAWTGRNAHPTFEPSQCRGSERTRAGMGRNEHSGIFLSGFG